MPHDSYKALYVHIPFCKSRCAYCDFVTSAVKQDSKEIDEYVDEINTQIRQWYKRGELEHIETVYLGGGTPSYIGNKRLSSLLYMLSISLPQKSSIEFSMEANPESITKELIKDIWALGVNRLSIGVQSFDNDVLSMLGRAHSREEAIRAIQAAQERFENISLDLMCGIPGQTLESFKESLETALSLNIAHVSVYPLTIEPHTMFYKMHMKGQIPDIDEDVASDMMLYASQRLSAAGFERYEVASYAKPGFSCKHNIFYWSGVPYLGIGRSAASMTQNSERRMRMQDGQVTDDLNPAQMIAEDLMLGMRMARGITFDQIENARLLLPQIDTCMKELVNLELVAISDKSYIPTTKGWLCGNELYGKIFDLA